MKRKRQEEEDDVDQKEEVEEEEEVKVQPTRKSPRTKKSETKEREELKNLEIREMEIDDLDPVFKLGEKLYDASWPNLYRTWDPYCITELFHANAEFCLVAEVNDKLIGYLLSTTLQKHAWKYGYCEWLGVEQEFQRFGVAKKLFDKFKELMIEEGVKIIIVDTQADNVPALRFFEKNGFGNPLPWMYLSKSLNTGEPLTSVAVEEIVPKKPTKGKKKKKVVTIDIRDMILADVSKVFHLGEKIFTADKSQSTYRAWDQFAVIEFFNGDSQYCLVAEVDGKVVGFCMGTTISKSTEVGGYGYITWIGVQANHRRRGVGTLLFNEMVSRMTKSGVKMLFVDIDVDNKPAASFFQKLGFGDQKKHVYMDLNISKNEAKKNGKKTDDKKTGKDTKKEVKKGKREVR